MNQLYVFIDSSFLFTEGCKRARKALGLPPTRKPLVDYVALRRFLERSGELKKLVFTGSDLPGTLISQCQMAGFDVQTSFKYPDRKTGKKRQKGVAHKICWEIAKTVFTGNGNGANRRIILCTGNKDLMAVLPDIHGSNWAVELWLWKNSFSRQYVDQVHFFGTVRVLDKEWKKFMTFNQAKPKGFRYPLLDKNHPPNGSNAIAAVDRLRRPFGIGR